MRCFFAFVFRVCFIESFLETFGRAFSDFTHQDVKPPPPFTHAPDERARGRIGGGDHHQPQYNERNAKGQRGYGGDHAVYDKNGAENGCNEPCYHSCRFVARSHKRAAPKPGFEINVLCACLWSLTEDRTVSPDQSGPPGPLLRGVKKSPGVVKRRGEAIFQFCLKATACEPSVGNRRCAARLQNPSGC